ncbi:MAG: hypothetical protein ACKVRP_10825 [Bacteroidota bacterium]
MSIINLNEFQRALSETYVRSLQVIHAALAIGVITFAAVVYVVYSNPPAENPSLEDAAELLQTLTIIHVLLALSCYLAAQIAFTRIAAPNQDVVENVPSVQSSLTRLRSALIVRLALFEAPAFFGLIVCMLGALNGVLHSQPEYWFNTFSSVIMLGLVVITFTTREKLEHTFSEKMTRG